MTLLEAIAHIASELALLKNWKMISISIESANSDNKNLLQAKCYPIKSEDPIMEFKLTFDQGLVEKK